MTTGNGNAESIPQDIMGRLLWAAKHFGALTVFAAVVIWQSWKVQATVSVERKESEQFVRQTLMDLNSKTLATIGRNTSAFDRFSAALEKRP